MGDESDSDSFLRPKRKRRDRYVIEDDDDDGPASSDSSIEITWQTKRIKAGQKNCIRDSDESDSDSSVEVIRRKRRIGRVNSDTSSISSGSTIIIRKTRCGARALSDTSTEDGAFESSQWETDDDEEQQPPRKKPPTTPNTHSSDSSDDQAEKCPICLLRFKQQEIGTPESCDHHFCVECIQEWSKNMNTCPVDRQPFALILVRRAVNGRVVRQIPVEAPNPQNLLELEEDAAYCEICGSSDREDRMLLCDGCNKGYHLECLTPPLHEVPDGYWYCNDCENDIDLFDIELLMEDDENMYFREGLRRNVNRRLPRTRQNERVRQRVERNRRTTTTTTANNTQANTNNNQAGPSTSRTNNRRRRRGYRTVYEVDAANGETIQVRKRVKRKRRKQRRKRKMAAEKQKTVKRRLAAQLGICRQRSTTQHVPDVRPITAHSDNIRVQRHEAGIPTLHLFGHDDAIDYFTDSDDGGGVTGGGGGVLLRRLPTRNDANVLRNRQMRRKMISVSAAAQPSSEDLLSSILESQAKLHSKNCVLSLNKDGSLNVETNNNRVNINNNNSVRYRQTPMQPNENNQANTTNSFIASDTNSSYNSFIPTAPAQSSSVIRSTSDSSDFERAAQDFNAQSALCDAYYGNKDDGKKDKKEKNCDSLSGDNTPKSTASDVHSDSELDIYSDIETVSTSKIEEQDEKPVTPVLLSATGSDDENNYSDTELVIDTEKLDTSDKYDPTAALDSSEESSKEETVSSSVDAAACVNTNTNNSGAAHSTSSELQSEKVQSTDEMKATQSGDEDEEGDEDGCPNFSIYSAESLNLAKKTDLELLSETNSQCASAIQQEEEPTARKTGNSNALYSDSEDDVKIDVPKTFGIGDIQNMTEDISEEERSYTPCLDEKTKEGLDGLDTELISDEDRNDFDEAQELKTASDGDALEINAKEFELDFAKAEDCEEGEIVDKLKKKQQEEAEEARKKEEAKKKDAEGEKENMVVVTSKESEKQSRSEFKKLSKSNKERNYRDKERSRSRSREKRRKEKRKELERYDVRTIIAEKPRRLKDKFGRDVSKRSPSRSSRSSSRSRRRRSRHSRSRTPERRRSRSRKRRRSESKKRRERSRSRHRGAREKRSKEWTPSSPEVARQASPSWTPPRVVDSAHNLTVILTNDSNGKKKDKKKKKSEKKGKEGEKKKKRRNKTPPPSKEVFASGDNILVSVSFNKDNETRDVTTKRKREHSESAPAKKPKKPATKTRKVRDLTGVKPVAIIDLDKSPFKELTPSPKDIIVLSDSDNGETNEMLGIQKAVCDSSQHVASPKAPAILGPKTPPEPQVKFSLNPKPQQLRPITNPLHDPDDVENEEQEEHPEETAVVHKGPNTPPDPPNSPPSSPDAYDPFEPTKSRSASPEPPQITTNNNSISVDGVESRPLEMALVDNKGGTPPDVALKSHTPPLLEKTQQPDSQSSSVFSKTPDGSKSPDVAGAQTQNNIFPPVIPPYSSAAAVSLITSTPVSSMPRINILSSTILTPSSVQQPPQQKIVLPSPVKSSPAKVPPTKSTTSKKRKPAAAANTKTDDVINLDFDSPYSPGSSDYEDLFEPPPEAGIKTTKPAQKTAAKSPVKQSGNAFDSLFGTSPMYGASKNKTNNSKSEKTKAAKKSTPLPKGTKQIGVKLDEDNLKILDELPNSAVEMQVKDKFLKKLNRQERVVEEVKLVLKPHYNKKHINKDEYKDILRRAVPKICHNRSGEINPKKIQNLIEAYVKKIRHSKKVTSSSSAVNPQKV